MRNDLLFSCPEGSTTQFYCSALNVYLRICTKPFSGLGTSRENGALLLVRRNLTKRFPNDWHWNTRKIRVWAIMDEHFGGWTSWFVKYCTCPRTKRSSNQTASILMLLEPDLHQGLWFFWSYKRCLISILLHLELRYHIKSVQINVTNISHLHWRVLQLPPLSSSRRLGGCSIRQSEWLLYDFFL